MEQSPKRAAPGIVPQVAKFVDLVNYQEGSVVSRTVVDKKTGTITLFAFGKGQGLSEHTAPFNALVYLLDGEAEITISGKALRLKDFNNIIRGINTRHGREIGLLSQDC